MNALILLSLICVCTAFPQVFIQDTPEVLAEKQKFYQLYNAAAAAAAAAPDIHIYTQKPAHTYNPNVIHNPVVQPQPYKQTYHQAYKAPTGTYTTKWTGPVAATVPAGLPGSVSQVRNTPEVEAAISNFVNTYNAALAATRVSHYPVDYHAPQQYKAAKPTNLVSHYPVNYHAPQQYHAKPVTKKWTGPVAATVPAGLPGSAHQVSDTQDVLAAKAEFNRAFQQQLMNVLG